MEEKKYIIGNGGLSITDKDRHFQTTIRGESWEIKIPLPSEKMYIARRTADLTGGYSKEQIGADQYEYIRMGVTLQTCLVTFPEWWSGVDSCVDDSLIYDLWRFYLDSEDKFASRLKTVLKSKNSRKSETTD